MAAISQDQWTRCLPRCTGLGTPVTDGIQLPYQPNDKMETTKAVLSLEKIQREQRQLIGRRADFYKHCKKTEFTCENNRMKSEMIKLKKEHNPG